MAFGKARARLNRRFTLPPPPADQSRWRHAFANGQPYCGAAVDSKPERVNIDDICSDCVRAALELLQAQNDPRRI